MSKNNKITPWYYDFYDPGKFPHQKTLCENVAWSCGLEGQKRTSATSLSAPLANSLTLRLRSLSKALDKLKREVSKTNIAIKKATNAELKKHNLFGILITFHSQDSPLKTEGAPVEVINIDSVNIGHTIYHKNIHNSLYDFFTNLGSILDRLAFEINLLYRLDDWLKHSIDWNKLVNRKDKLKLLESLRAKDASLCQFIEDKSSVFADVKYYRNRLIHDAVLNTKVDLKGFPRKFHIFLPDDPRNMDSPNNTDAIMYCNDMKKCVLELLDESYILMLQHYMSHGRPPWLMNHEEAINAHS